VQLAAAVFRSLLPSLLRRDLLGVRDAREQPGRREQTETLAPAAARGEKLGETIEGSGGHGGTSRADTPMQCGPARTASEPYRHSTNGSRSTLSKV
jgi:hypothetical protein